MSNPGNERADELAVSRSLVCPLISISSRYFYECQSTPVNIFLTQFQYPQGIPRKNKTRHMPVSISMLYMEDAFSNKQEVAYFYEGVE